MSSEEISRTAQALVSAAGGSSQQGDRRMNAKVLAKKDWSGYFLKSTRRLKERE